jgi:hypothetical protein
VQKLTGDPVRTGLIAVAEGQTDSLSLWEGQVAIGHFSVKYDTRNAAPGAPREYEFGKRSEGRQSGVFQYGLWTRSD